MIFEVNLDYFSQGNVATMVNVSYLEFSALKMYGYYVSLLSCLNNILG